MGLEISLRTVLLGYFPIITIVSALVACYVLNNGRKLEHLGDYPVGHAALSIALLLFGAFHFVCTCVAWGTVVSQVFFPD